MKRKPARKKRNTARRRSLSRNILITGIILAAVFALPLAHSLQNGFSKRPFCANSISCIKDVSGKFEEGAVRGEFNGESVLLPSQLISEARVPASRVLGNTTLKKRIEIDLTNQRLYGIEGDGSVVYSFPVSTGKWAPTPTGIFRIWIKLRYTRMTGGNAAIGTFYDLPNVPYTMFIYNSEHGRAEGYSIHGAYWHNNFGHPMSHGCINMRISDAKLLFSWAEPPTTSGWATYATAKNPGTEVRIYGVTPQE